MHACMEEEGRGGGEDQRMWLHASLFVPHVWELLLVRFCLRSCRLDISFVPGGLRCYSVNSPEARVLLQPCHLQTWSEERRHHVEGGANLSGLTGRKKKKKTGSHTQSHKHKPIWANTKQKPWLWYKQAAHALEQSRFIDVVVCPLLGWCAERTRIQHELIITSVWSCLKKSRYTPTLHVPVCLCFVSECQTHHCVFSLHCLFLYIYISPVHQPVLVCCLFHLAHRDPNVKIILKSVISLLIFTQWSHGWVVRIFSIVILNWGVCSKTVWAG